MSKRNSCWGLEVGTDAIKAVHLVLSGSDVVLAEYDVLPFKKILTTPDLNVDEAIQVGLDQFLTRHNVTKSTVVASVPGNAAFARFAKLPPVDPRKIPDIVKFEAVQQIPFPIDQVEWDYQVFAQPDSPDVEVGIFAITKDRVIQFLSNYRNVGLTLDGLTLSPLAVYNALAYDEPLDDQAPGTIIMDIGTTSTDVIIVEQDNLWLRTLPIGGNNFTEALARAFKLSFPKAEKLKREAGTSKYARQIFQAMRPVFADLLQELQRSLGYYQSLNRDAKLTRLIGLGSTFRLPGLQKFIKQQLQLEVVRPHGFRKINVDGKHASEFADQALNLATAYGLALQGLGMAKVDANILPRHIIKQRIWKAKQPWIAAAAALVVLGVGLAWSTFWRVSGNHQSVLLETKGEIDRTLADARSKVVVWDNLVKSGVDPRQNIENLRRILDYRDVWPKLMYDLHLATQALNPQPETLAPDYSQLTPIPRDQRRRMYIESLNAAYKSDVAGGDYQEIFGERRSAAPPWHESDMMGPPPPGPPPAAPTDAKSPPSFEIILKGITPYHNAPRFLADHFEKWLHDHAVRADRPYRIVTTDKTLFSIVPVGQELEDSGRREDPGTFGPMMGPSGPTLPDVNRPFAPIPDGRGGRTATRIDMLSLLPIRPGQGELVSTDWRFEIHWTIELIRPEDARQSEDVAESAVSRLEVAP